MDGPNLAAALRAAAAELAALAVETDGLGTAGIVAAERWQALDRISQHMADLGVFLAAAADLVPDVSVASAFAGLRVGAMRQCLAGRPADATADAGSLELFSA